MVLIVAGCAADQATGQAVAADPTAVASPTSTTPNVVTGVAISPRSYEGSDLPDFLSLIDGEVDLLMHAGDWGEIEQENSAFDVMAALARQQDLQVMAVLSPNSADGLIRPIDASSTAAYLGSLQRFVAMHKPEFLGLANEVNLLESKAPAEFEAVVALWDQAIAVVRSESPDTQIFVTFQYEWLTGHRGGWFGATNNASTQWDLIAKFSGADAVGITTYPSLVFDTVDEIPDGYYDELRTRIDLPILVTEAGWTADTSLSLNSGSEDEQAAFAARLKADSIKLAMPVSIWTFVYANQVDQEPFRGMGLYRDDGTPRAAWNVWTDN